MLSSNLQKLAEELIGGSLVENKWINEVDTTNNVKSFRFYIIGEGSFVFEAPATEVSRSVASAMVLSDGDFSPFVSKFHLPVGFTDRLEVLNRLLVWNTPSDSCGGFSDEKLHKLFSWSICED